MWLYDRSAHEIVTHLSSCSLSKSFIEDRAVFTDQLQKDSGAAAVDGCSLIQP